MIKRILAWTAILGFVLLIINITFFRFMIEISIIVYTLILAYFLLTQMNSKKGN